MTTYDVICVFFFSVRHMHASTGHYADLSMLSQGELTLPRTQ